MYFCPSKRKLLVNGAIEAKILISSILLIVLLMLPDEATSQRRRRGMIAPNTAQNDSLHGNDSLKADTVTVRMDSIAPAKKETTARRTGYL